MNYFVWTVERLELLRQLWPTHTATEIAERLGDGVTRSAVCGKANRAGIVKPKKEPKPQAVRRAKAPRKPRTDDEPKPVNRGPEAFNLRRRLSYLARPEVVHNAPVLDVSFARPWTERKGKQCAFPVGGQGADTVSCCHPTEATYCPAHADMMFSKPAEVGSRYARSLRRWAA